MTYFSGTVDEHDHVRLGGYPGALRELLGGWVEEFFPLPPDQQVKLDDGSSADLWTEWLHLTGAPAIASYVDGPLPGVPAVTEHSYRDGTAATRLDTAGTAAIVDRALDRADVHPVADAGPGVEVVRRHGDGQNWLFVLNHTEQPVEVSATGRELIRGADCAGTVDVTAGGVAVIREGRVVTMLRRNDRR